MSIEIAKKAAAQAAVRLIQPGMRIGLGSGTTAHHFITALGIRCREEKLKIEAIASSEASYTLAKQFQIPLLDVQTVTHLNLTVDGADEVDRQKRLIKGGGGALLREKIVAHMSDEMVVIIDSTKRVEALGAFPLPVEITPFGSGATLAHLQKMGYQGTLRIKEGKTYLTDNDNYIWDLRLPFPCHKPEEHQQKIRSIPGVVETGLFLNLAGRILTGFPDGHVELEE